MKMHYGHFLTCPCPKEVYEGLRFDCKPWLQRFLHQHSPDKGHNLVSKCPVGGEQLDRMTETERLIGMWPNHILGKVGMRPTVFWAPEWDRITFWAKSERDRIIYLSQSEQDRIFLIDRKETESHFETSCIFLMASTQIEL
jgi:hypothetical protein